MQTHACDTLAAFCVDDVVEEVMDEKTRQEQNLPQNAWGLVLDTHADGTVCVAWQGCNVETTKVQKSWVRRVPMSEVSRSGSRFDVNLSGRRPAEASRATSSQGVKAPNSPKVDQDIKNAADRYNVFVWEAGFESIDRRLVVELAPEAAWVNLPWLGDSKNELPTILPTGEKEQERQIRMHPTQAVTTYAEHTTIRQDILKNAGSGFVDEEGELKDTYAHFFYDLPAENEMHRTHRGVLQTWSLNYNQEFKDKASPAEGGLDLIVAATGGEVNVEAVREKIFEFERGLEEQTFHEEADRRAHEVCKGIELRASALRRAITSFLDRCPTDPDTLKMLQVRYVAVRSRVQEPLFVGTVADMNQFFTINPRAREFVDMKDYNAETRTMTVHVKCKGARIGDGKAFKFPEDREYIVVYRRKGYQSFYCVKGLRQFLKEGVFNKAPFRLSMNEFMQQADPENIPKHIKSAGGYGTIQKYRLNDELFAVKTCNRKKDMLHEEAAFKLLWNHPHPCVIRVFLWGTYRSEYKLVMEIASHNLEEAIMDKAPTLEDKRAWAGQIYLGLEHLHRNKVVHRDLKPPNMVITSENIAKITDYGHSRVGVAIGSSNSSKSSGALDTYGPQVFGTMGYSAPEAYEFKTIDTDRRVIPDLGNQAVTYAELRMMQDPSWTETNLDNADDAEEIRWLRYFSDLEMQEELLTPLLGPDQAAEKDLPDQAMEHVSLETRDLYAYGCCLYFLFEGKHPDGANLEVSGDNFWNGPFKYDEKKKWRTVLTAQFGWQARINKVASEDSCSWQALASQIIRHNPRKRIRHASMRQCEFLKSLSLLDGYGDTVENEYAREKREQNEDDSNPNNLADPHMLLGGRPQYGKAARDAWWWITRDMFAVADEQGPGNDDELSPLKRMMA